MVRMELIKPTPLTLRISHLEVVLMKCNRCGHNLDLTWRACPMCGTIISFPGDKFRGQDSPRGSGKYSNLALRAQVVEVIVRQAIAGAPWKEICRGPMQVNNITVDEIEIEVKRRMGGPGSLPRGS